MKHCWYSRFLFVSLLLYIIWMGTAVFVKNEPPAETLAEAEQAGKMPPETWAPEPPAAAETAREEVVPETASEAESEESVTRFPENFQETLFIGDSRTVGLWEYGQLGEADVFADSGMTVFTLWDKEKQFDGQKLTLEQLLSEKNYQMIHFMLGINELGYPMDRIAQAYRESVIKIQSLQPQAKIVLGANLHVTASKSAASSIYNNERINELNERIKAIGRELSCSYLDINERFDDGTGNMAEEYSADGSHVLGKYYADWVQWICETPSAVPR